LIVPESFAQDIAAVASIRAVPTILGIICRTTGMGFAAVARVTEDRWVACGVHDAIAFGLQPAGELAVETTICHEIRRHRNPVVIDNVAEDPEYRGHHTPARYGLQSYISVPIILSDGSFFGTLCAIDPAPHRLKTPETIEMFEMFADVIGFQLSAIDSVANTEARLEEERKISALREQFIAVLGHDLRNPLTGILGGMEMLQKNPLNDRASQWAQMVVASAGRMAELIDVVMDFSRSRLGGGLTLERDVQDEIAAVLHQIVAELQTGESRRMIETNFDVTVPVYCDLKRLAQLASNLLGNALTYGDPDRPIRITAVTANGRFEMSVANGGAQIPDSLLKNIFEPFSRGTVQPSREGLGLGLYISHQIALAHGGDLVVSSTPEETRFTFRMPLEQAPGKTLD
jgi:signal transduction histidine kinase